MAVFVLSTLGACGGGGVSGRGGADRLTGSLTVFAAASLTDALHDGQLVLERRHPGFHVNFSFAGSQQLVSNVLGGAPADVIATADSASMKRLSETGLVGLPRAFGRNSLAIAVAPGNPRGIRTLADLARPDLAVVLADPSVPAGHLARQALEKAHAVVRPKSNELDVRSALEKVELGDADAAIVYVTDVSSAARRVAGVSIPDSQNVETVYPIAAVRSSPRHAVAEAYVEQVVTGSVQEALRRRGFAGP